MLKKILILLSIVLLSQLSAKSAIMDKSGIKDAEKALDCEFEDCTPKEPKVIIKKEYVPVIIVKEKIVTKEVPVERIVEKEKVVYVDRVVPVVAATTPMPEKAVTGRTYNKAFFDVHASSQAPMLDYINFDKRASFDVKQFIDTVTKIKSGNTKVYIHGSIAVPDSIKTEQVYVDAGTKYHFHSYGWDKEIRYNKMGNRQDADYFLVTAFTDKTGHRYINYKIKLNLRYAKDLKESEENVAPNTFFFKIAPKVRGFKNKFIRTTVFISE